MINHNLTLKFVDVTKSDCTIQVNKNEFLTKCEEKQIHYFCRMFSDFVESTEHEVQLNVPFASAMKSVVESIIGIESELNCANDIIKQVYCMDFLAMDFVDEFRKLLHLDVNIDTYDLVHQFVDSKSYNRKLYLRFLATKLPDNYNLNNFPKELVELMQDAGRSNLLITSSESVITIYDTGLRSIVSEFTLNSESALLAINSTRPIIAIRDNADNLSCISIVNIFSKQIIKKIITKDPDAQYKRMCACFSSDGNELFVSRGGCLRKYSCDDLNTAIEYSLFKKIRSIHCAPDGKLLVLVLRCISSVAQVDIVNLSTCTSKRIYRGNVIDAKFIDNSTVVFNDHEHEKLLMYNILESTTEFVGKIASVERVVCHPNKNYYITHHTDNSRCNLYYRNNLINSFTTSPICFSSDGKYIYSFESGKIVRNCLDDNGNVSEKKTLKIGIDHAIKSIANVNYSNKELEKKIAHLTNVPKN